MNAQEIISSGILELYCMGIAAPEEVLQVEQWAVQYPEVAAELSKIQSGLEAYAQAHAVTPAAAVKERIFDVIGSGATAPVVSMETNKISNHAVLRSISPVWKYAAAAGIVLFLGSSILNYTFYSRYKMAVAELASTQTALQQQKELADNMHNDMGVMTDKNAMPVSLKPMPDVPEAAARIYWMQNTKEVYIDPSNLPQAPAGKQYQFWAIVDGKPVNGGIIKTEINGKIVHVQKMKSFGNAQAFAVSLEDAGPEKPVPSKVMVMGKI